MVFQHPSGFTALRSARRQNFWRRGSPRNFAQNGTSRAWRPLAERRSGAASRRTAKRCRRSYGRRKAGASRRPARNNTLNRRRTTYIREAKSPRPSPIHTLITHQPHRADRGGRILARPLSVRRARAHGAGVRPALPHVLERAPPSCFPAANPRRCSMPSRSRGTPSTGQLFADVLGPRILAGVLRCLKICFFSNFL